jgi:MoaA/NifB/PqqE/SkfB family radical SAM enzyme/SAM-dependent methyltransferase
MAFNLDLWTRFEYNGIPIYIRGDKPDWFVPNSLGDKSLQQYAKGGVDLNDILVRRFLDRLPDDPVLPYNGRAEYLQTDYLRELWLHVTNRCNQACRPCLFAASPKAKGELPVAQIREIAAQAASLGCKVFALTGGEPFFHREFAALVDCLLEVEAAHVVVLTNGMLLRNFAQSLARWSSDRFHLQISVDGLRHNHDFIRGPGSFDALMVNLDWLKEQKIPFTISMCVDSGNVNDMPEIVDFAAGVGAANLHFIWYFVRGRGMAERFVHPEIILPRLLEAAERSAKSGIRIDNLEVLRSQIFAPSGTIHDGANSGWESLAVGPDCRLYPSPALVGVKALATEINGNLGGAWRQSSILAELRRSTAASLTSPLRDILGGGDPDYSYLHGGAFVGGDPYLPLYEQMALWLIAREAARQPADGPPRLRLKMGEILEACGSHGPVALTHTNCLLAAALPDSHTAVRDFYQEAAHSTKSDILNPIGYPEDAIAHIPIAARLRNYGCGSPVIDANLRPGEQVLDLGCGTGVECFIAARQVGAEGRVIGVDMLEAMLTRAELGAQGVAANLGYFNLEFKKGYLEDLPIRDNSIDAVLSNCVINLSSHKRRTFAEIFRVLKEGGRLVVSDVVCETEPDRFIRNDEILRGECIAGCLTQRDLFGLLDESGFVAPRILKRFPYRVVRGQQFFSLTYAARKPAATVTKKVLYRGPFAAVMTHQGTLLPVGLTREVDLEELDAGPDDLFVFDSAGAVSNIPMEAPSCCSPAATDCCAPLETPKADFFRPHEKGLANLTLIHGVKEGNLQISLPPRGEPKPVPAHCSGCMVCGAELRYLNTETECQCSYCYRTTAANAMCEHGHFVCDSCHTRDALALVEHICLTTRETDLIALMQEIRQHPAFPVHGPEHHALVPGVVLATYRNLGGEITSKEIATALSRGKSVAGGSCGFMGVCGTVTGVGTAFSLLLKANPVRPKERRQVQLVTHAVMQTLAQFEAARCCQRECWLALKKAAELSADLLPITLKADAEIVCRQSKHNKECLKNNCPFYKPN